MEYGIIRIGFEGFFMINTYMRIVLLLVNGVWSIPGTEKAIVDSFQILNETEK